jgi:O-antigen ligase
MTSVLEGRRSAVRERVEEILFELDEYAATGDPSGHSIAMRLEFWKTGLSIARREWLIGVGTGDTQHAFDAEYERRNSPLEQRWRLRAHNQFLTLWISFGAFGFLWCMIAWAWPALRTGAWRDPVFIAWALTFAISCLTDDTPETQAGATFFAFFYALLVFGREAPPPRGTLT